MPNKTNYFSDLLLSGDAFLDFHLVHGSGKEIEEVSYSVTADFSDITLSKDEYEFLAEETDKVIESAVKEYLKQFRLDGKYKKYVKALDSVNASTARLLPKSALNKKTNVEILKSYDMDNNPDYIIVTNWNAKLPDILKEFLIENNEKIRQNKAVFDMQDKNSALRIDDDCMYNFLRACCCRCSLKDKGTQTCNGGEYVVNRHGYCEDFKRA